MCCHDRARFGLLHELSNNCISADCLEQIAGVAASGRWEAEQVAIVLRNYRHQNRNPGSSGGIRDHNAWLHKRMQEVIKWRPQA